MKERPILFNTAMVQAILSGRKTQTRRPLKPCKDANFNCELALHEIAGEINTGDFSNSKVGQPGDRLWVRESFRLFNSSNECGCSESPCGCPRNGTPIYRATHDDGESKWKPSIHMPRAACRIVLEITNVRVERLRNISESDACAEGYPVECEDEAGTESAQLWFREVRNSTGGDWNANPWVLVIEFKVLTVNGVVPEVAA